MLKYVVIFYVFFARWCWCPQLNIYYFIRNMDNMDAIQKLSKIIQCVFEKLFINFHWIIYYNVLEFLILLYSRKIITHIFNIYPQCTHRIVQECHQFITHKQKLSIHSCQLNHYFSCDSESDLCSSNDMRANSWLKEWISSIKRKEFRNLWVSRYYKRNDVLCHYTITYLSVCWFLFFLPVKRIHACILYIHYILRFIDIQMFHSFSLLKNNKYSEDTNEDCILI